MTEGHYQKCRHGMSRLKSQRQADLCEFAANLVYIASSRHQPMVHSETLPQKINTKIMTAKNPQKNKKGK